MGGAFGRIARLLRRHASEPGDPVSDAELLGRFVNSADQSAFELLVWRHAVMVFGVCRRIVRDEHLAEDAFQATFLVLARKAGSVRGSNLAGWLFRVARRVAVRAQTQAAARANREAPLAAEPAAPPDTSGEVLAILDEEIGRLPERFRLPVVLCYLGGRSTEDAARVLGCPRGTVLSRLATARSRLAARLTRRGVTVPTALFTVAAVPTGLGAVAPLIAPAVRLALGKSGGSVAIVLADGVMTAMSMGKTITAAGVFVLAVGLVTGVGLVAADGPAPEAAQKPGAVQPPEKAKPPVRNPPAVDELEMARQERLMRLERLADQLKSEIQARERTLQRLVQEVTGGPAVEAAQARLDRTISKLDDEVFTAEKEFAELEAQIELLKRKLGGAPPDVPAEEVARLVEADARVADLLKQRTEKELLLNRELRTQGANSPAAMAVTADVKLLEESISRFRQTVRAEVEAALKFKYQKHLTDRLTELQDRLAVVRELLKLRKTQRDDSERKLALQRRAAIDHDKLVQELSPLQDALKKVETLLLDTRIERELKAPPEAKPLGVEAKLDKLIREVEELRREVRELRKP